MDERIDTAVERLLSRVSGDGVDDVHFLAGLAHANAERMEKARGAIISASQLLVKAAEVLGEPPKKGACVAMVDGWARGIVRYPCSATCTHEDAKNPGHPERVKALSADMQAGPDAAERKWAETSVEFDRGAEAMRAACWEAVQVLLQREGVHPTSTPWTGLKAAIEGATPQPLPLSRGAALAQAAPFLCPKTKGPPSRKSP